MSTRGIKLSPLRGYRRRKTVLNLDLNNVPCDDRDQEGTSSHVGSQEVQVNQQEPSTSLTMIDVDAIEDDVIESSARAFAEAKSKARRNRERTEVIAIDSAHIRDKRRRVSSNQTIISCDLFINLESHNDSMRENVTKHTDRSKHVPIPPRPPPKEPTFSCPICMGTLVEEMSTKCGHIFCKACINTAIAAQNKCPTCRKKVTVKDLIRVFLPATR